MNNVYYGSLLIAICCFGYWFAYKKYLQENYNRCLFIIVACGLILRIFVGSDLFLHQWDERYHALVAKNLSNHPLIPTLYDNPLFPYDYTNWAGNHIWLSKPIFPFWLISISIFIFGENEIAIRIPSFILSILAIFLTHQIGKHLFSDKIGILAAFFHSIHGLLIEAAGGRISSDHVETAFIFFTELSVLFCILSVRNNKYLLFSCLAGISVGIALLCKAFPSMIIFPIWFCLIVFSKRFTYKYIATCFLLIIASCLMVSLPWLTYIYVNFPLETKWMFGHLLFPYTSVLEEHYGEWWYYLDKIRIVFGEII